MLKNIQYFHTYKILIFLVAIILPSLTSCAIFQIDTMKNTQFQKEVVHTNATENIKLRVESENNSFIGIAASGGGARAANFTAAVLLELQELGILQHATLISSVSGSSLTAAYYGLYGNSKYVNQDHPWDVNHVRNVFLKPLQTKWIMSWFNPFNFIPYWFTNFSRSDIMINVLNNELYDEQGFSEIKNDPSFPSILINATSYNNGLPFCI